MSGVAPQGYVYANLLRFDQPLDYWLARFDGIEGVQTSHGSETETHRRDILHINVFCPVRAQKISHEYLVSRVIIQTPTKQKLVRGSPNTINRS